MRYSSDKLNQSINESPNNFSFFSTEQELVRELLDNKIIVFFANNMQT